MYQEDVDEGLTNPFGALRFKQSLIHFISGKFLGMIIGIGWLLMLVRILSATDYGTYVAFTGIGEFLIGALSFGVTEVVLRYVPELHSIGASKAVTQLVIRTMISRTLCLIGGCSLTAFLGPWLLGQLSIPGTEVAFTWYMVAIASEGLGRFVEIIFDSLLLQRLSQLSTLTRYAMRSAALSVYFFTYKTITIKVWTFTEALCLTVSLFPTFILLFRTMINPTIFPYPKSSIKPNILSYMLYGFPAYCAFLIYLFTSVDAAKIVSARLFDPNIIALFGFCLAFGATLQKYLPSLLLLGMLRPLFVAAAFREDAASRFDLLFGTVIKANTFLMIPLIFASLIAGDQVISLMSGGRFANGGFILTVILTWAWVNSIRGTYMLINTAQTDGRGAVYSVILSLLVFAVTVLIVGITNGGPSALLEGMILAEVAACSFLRQRIRRSGLHITYPFKPTVKIAISGLAGMIVVLFFKNYADLASDELVFFGLILEAVIYFSLVAFLKPFSAAERRHLNSFLPIPLFVW